MVHSNKYSMNKISIALEFLWSIIFYIIFALVMNLPDSVCWTENGVVS